MRLPLSFLKTPPQKSLTQVHYGLTRLDSKNAWQKCRKTASTVSLECDMYIYVVDVIYTVILAVTAQLNIPTMYIIVLLAWQFSFPIKSHFQAMSTETTRRTYQTNCKTLFKFSWNQVYSNLVAGFKIIGFCSTQHPNHVHHGPAGLAVLLSNQEPLSGKLNQKYPAQLSN